MSKSNVVILYNSLQRPEERGSYLTEERLQVSCGEKLGRINEEEAAVLRTKGHDLKL